MAVHFSVDASEVHQLTIELEHAPARLRANLGESFALEADALHRDMKRDAEGHRYLPTKTKRGLSFPKALKKTKLGPLDYEIGFEKSGAGNLANIIVFGSANNAPVYDFYGPLHRRIGPFVEHLGRIAEDSVFTGPAEL